MNKYYHCKTQDQFDWLMKKMEKDYNINPLPLSYWNVKKEKTAIHLEKNRFYKISFQSIDYLKDKDITDFIDVGELMENENKENKFNLPNHYNFQGLKQPTMDIINIISEENSGGVFKIGWYLANALKYLFRFRRKDGIKDLKKARDYIDRLIDYFESEGK